MILSKLCYTGLRCKSHNFLSNVCQVSLFGFLQQLAITHNLLLHNVEIRLNIYSLPSLFYLYAIFPLQKVPSPEKSYVTRWYKDRLIQMAYSYIPVGGSGELYDDLAAEVNNKVYFAGEVLKYTNFKQSMPQGIFAQ